MQKHEMDFIVESNRIEGILRAPTTEEIAEFSRFMALDNITVADMEEFVRVYQPNASLRSKKHMDVMVGGYIAPRGGPEIKESLEKLLCSAMKGEMDQYEVHVRYELLHPFIDGNGRSGRMLWYWMATEIERKRGFLHSFYYQALDHAR